MDLVGIKWNISVYLQLNEVKLLKWHLNSFMLQIFKVK